MGLSPIVVTDTDTKSMPDSRIVSASELDAKAARLRVQIEDNRILLARISRYSENDDYYGEIKQDSHEMEWTRAVLTNRANMLKESLDRVQRICELYRQNKTTEAIREQQKLVGLLFIDGQIKGKISPDVEVFP